MTNRPYRSIKINMDMGTESTDELTSVLQVFLLVSSGLENTMVNGEIIRLFTQEMMVLMGQS